MFAPRMGLKSERLDLIDLATWFAPRMGLKRLLKQDI